MKQISRMFVLLPILIFLTSCDRSPDHIVVDSKNLSASIPPDFRMLAREEISATITLNGIATTHQGSDHLAGSWQIPIDVEVGQSYDLSIQWFLNDLLLMEETGVFTVSEDELEIRPVLDFVNTGLRKFDNDCDGLSNLLEVRQGSNPEMAEDAGNGICLGEPDESVELTEANRAFVTSFHDDFIQVSQDNVVQRFEQPLQIRKSTDQPSQYGFNLYAPPIDGATVRATINLAIDNEAKIAQVRFTRALAESASPFTGSRCFSYVSEASGLPESGCDMPFDWQEYVWYSLVLEQTGDQWVASIKNMSTGLEEQIGSFTGDTVHRWQSLQIGIGLGGTFSANDCTTGVQPIRAHYGRAIVNSRFFSEPLMTRTDIGNCVTATGDWNLSSRPELERPTYAFELGSRE